VHKLALQSSPSQQEQIMVFSQVDDA